MRRSFLVSLDETAVGHLVEDDDGRVTFRFQEDYTSRVHRLVLGQSFEDDLTRPYRGKRSELPAYFANLVPEGPAMRSLIENSLQIPAGDDLALLAAVGQDLPGAVVISSAVDGVDDLRNGDAGVRLDEWSDTETEEPVLRFSLAGVQLKFSVLREAEKLVLPAHGRLGEWIVKLDSARFPRVVANELATMEWARAAGFDVPECHLQTVSSLAPTLRSYAKPETSVLVIRRYDRDGARRIHQEDFAQVVSQPPRLKYSQISYEQCAVLVRQIVGEDGYFEFIRRLAFVIASGNTDAHLKNWSLVYPDGVNATLSPLYDQVCTIAWEELPRVLALKLSGKKNLLQIDEKAFVRLAEKADGDVGQTVRVLRDTLARIAEAWSASEIDRLMPPEHVPALRAYWKDAPLLKPLAEALG